MFAITVDELDGDRRAGVGRECSRWRESDEEAEEATRKAESVTCFCEKEKSPKEVTC
jgi:hypothetical protein